MGFAALDQVAAPPVGAGPGAAPGRADGVDGGLAHGLGALPHWDGLGVRCSRW